jgi:hypothetical protein
MNTKEQWQEEFSKLNLDWENTKSIQQLVDFIRETREQAKKEERDKILETLWNTPSSMIPEALQRISKQ